MMIAPLAAKSASGPSISPFAILGALVVGLAVGLGFAALAPDRVASATAIVAPIGSLWLRALQMTIIPLVVSLLITGIVASVAAARAGRLAGWSIGLFMVVLWCGAIMSAVMTPLLLDWWPIAPAAADALRSGIAGVDAPAEVPPFSEFLTAIIPTNPVAAAAQDQILPLILFTLIFALAITRLEPAGRDRLAGLFAALSDAMLIVIGWVLALAPIGVAALAFVVAAQTGTAAIGAFLHYVLIVSAIGAIVWIAAYPLAALLGRVSPLAFARAVLPAQAVAISTQSSLASLPAMLKGAKALGVRDTSADVTLPLAVALFRATGPAMNLAVAVYVAHLVGVELTAGTLAIGVAVAATTTLGSVSLPGSISFISAIAPIALAMGVPIEPLALLIAVETLPDIIRTLGNVTMDTAAAAIADNHAGHHAMAPTTNEETEDA